MLPRWFHLAVAAEIAAVIAVVVVGVRLVGQGVHATGDALAWTHPARHAPPLPSPLPDLGGVLAQPSPGVPRSTIAGIEMLSPRLFSQLDRQTGAFAQTEYGLLLDLETLARDEIERLLSGVHVPSAP